MKVLLLNPPRFKGMPVGREDRCENTIPNVLPPMGLVYLAGILEQEHVVKLIDANGYNQDLNYLKSEIEEESPDVVIFRATPETFYLDIEVARIAKEVKNSVKTVMICWSLTKLAAQVLEKAMDVDYYVIDYYYERVIPQILKGKSSTRIKGIAYRSAAGIQLNAPEEESFDFNSISMPAWRLIPDFRIYWVQIPSFRPYAMVESAKGCGMGCSFCTIARMKPVFREVSKVADEIEYLYRERGVKYIGFFDATFNIQRKRVLEICEELIQRKLTKLRWFANIRGDRMDEEQARVMRQAGCRGVSVGIESGSQQVLDLAHKRLKVSDAAKTIEILKKTGIAQYLSFILGLPGETLETVNETRQFIRRTKPTGFQVNGLVPYPGCQLYDDAVQHGKIQRLSFDNLLLYNTPVSLCDLTTEEINRSRRQIYKQIYTDPGWWFSNTKALVKSPENIGVGIDYGLKVIRRLVKGMGSEV